VQPRDEMVNKIARLSDMAHGHIGGSSIRCFRDYSKGRTNVHFMPMSADTTSRPIGIKAAPTAHVAEEIEVTNTTTENVAPGTTGLVLHAAAGYDLLIWLVTFGRERAFREKILQLAHLQPGEFVLDVGCGTGTLAIAAKRQVGSTGAVYGLDASPEMIARANKKARKAGVDVVFKNAAAQALPFPDAQFDAALTTLMLHHLPRKARQQCTCEIRRVLKPGGRVLAVDFGGSAPARRGLFRHFHRHGHVNLRDIIGLLTEAGLSAVESGAVGMKDLQFVLATVPPGR
jgi:ubiquinone/menaquinone biosynthesis C-methylase UbiE